MTKQGALGTKTLTTPKTTNTELLTSAKRRSNFDLVMGGTCPHDGAKLGDEIHGRGVGVTRTCEKCSHKWYLNTQIRTCKCVTCSDNKQKQKTEES